MSEDFKYNKIEVEILDLANKYGGENCKKDCEKKTWRNINSSFSLEKRTFLRRLAYQMMGIRDLSAMNFGYLTD